MVPSLLVGYFSDADYLGGNSRDSRGSHGHAGRSEQCAYLQLVDLFSILLEGSESMHERLINISLTQQLLVCFAGLVLMYSGLYTFHHVVCRSTRQLGSA